MKIRTKNAINGGKNYTKIKNGEKGITLIALIVTIIVLLLLAGVTIATLTGDNGILSQAQNAQESTKIGKFRDDAHLAYMEVYAENARNGVYVVEETELIAKLQEPQYGYNIHTETTGGVTGITVKQNGTVVNTETAATVVKAEQTPAETSATLTVIPDGGEGTEYYIIDGGKYYLINLVGAEITIGEGQESVESSGSGSSPTLAIDNAESLTKLDEPQISGLTITIVGRTVGDETLTINYGGQTAEVKVTVKEPAIAFRNYGAPLNSGTYGNTYSLTSTGETIKVDINDTPSDATDDVEVADNWKIFYEDADFLYLIYGDYYPANAQKEITSGYESAIYIPAHDSSGNDSTYLWSVNSLTNRARLWDYLKNYNDYGTKYQSWSKLQESISGLSKMSGKVLSIQGAPDIELWVNSWNAKYDKNTKLKTTKGIYGYNLMLETESNNGNLYIEVNSSPYNGATDETKGTGYYDRLYFPNRGNSVIEEEEPFADKALGYWLASLGNQTYVMCSVGRKGRVSCNSRTDSTGVYYSARPCIAIRK